MIKIEKLSADCKATVVRADVAQPVFLHQMLTQDEFNTLLLTQGELVYSVDEMIVNTIKAPGLVEVAKPVVKPVAKPAAKTVTKK